MNAVDRLNIVAHDKFQEIVDDAKRPDSPIQLQHIVLDPSTGIQKLVTVISKSTVSELLFPDKAAEAAGPTEQPPAPLFATESERKVAQIAYR
ncbi:hypothetical protein J8F10_03645 [Gemmata sp. G18]|uniref:Uncharacterized protein n=1 Tax=Gemmata palustris TaxID=2822762 RepID=A0ABS5BKZ4_9BACT|nr:hypothetical protein [Gemmata palustris]MBP3954384.1 hypothetical protein [Gemmata palustris]